MALEGERCWYTASGGAAGATLQLSFGNKLRRERPLSNPVHSPDYRRNQGSHTILIWCTWRLELKGRVLTSSADADLSRVAFINRLRRKSVLSAKAVAPGPDLTLSFSDGLILRVFADNVGASPPIRENWELWSGDELLIPSTTMRRRGRSKAQQRQLT
jgi:hypothetical protein